MQAPQSPPPAPPPMQPSGVPPSNPYDFIMNNSTKPKRSFLPKGNSKNQRILIVIIGISLLLLVGALLYGVMTASSSAGDSEMITATQQQQELARVAELANGKARETDTQNTATITAETMKSDQASLIAYLKKNGKKLSNKQLAATKSEKTDAALLQAAQINHFDDTFNATLAKEMVAYQKTLKNAHDHASSNTAKKLIEQMYNHANALAAKLQSSVPAS